MSDDSQILVPPSFVALFVPPGGARPLAARAEITARYEFCEALADLAAERAGTLQWDLGITQEDVLERIAAGLQDAASGVSPDEAGWILRRVRELLEDGRPAGRG